MNTAEQLRIALDELKGMKADEIAALMQKRGIKGRPGTTRNCPLAQFFSNTNTGTWVIGRSYIMRVSGRGKDSHVEKAATPKNLVAFLVNFDKGRYPALMAPPPRCLGTIRKGPRKRGEKGRNRPSHIKINHFAKDVERFAEP